MENRNGTWKRIWKTNLVLLLRCLARGLLSQSGGKLFFTLSGEWTRNAMARSGERLVSFEKSSAPDERADEEEGELIIASPYEYLPKTQRDNTVKSVV
jgi:hypothetical protein